MDANHEFPIELRIAYRGNARGNGMIHTRLSRGRLIKPTRIHFAAHLLCRMSNAVVQRRDSGFGVHIEVRVVHRKGGTAIDAVGLCELCDLNQGHRSDGRENQVLAVAECEVFHDFLP